MKAFINDWNYEPETFDINTVEKKEYPINAWITHLNGQRTYLVSAYLYEEYVLFLQIGDATSCNNFHEVEYEINNLQTKNARGGTFRQSEINQPDGILVMDRQPLAGMSPEDEAAEDICLLWDEYCYLYKLAIDTGRIPKELQGQDIVFHKTSVSFEKPVNEINQLTVYPQTQQFKNYPVSKTFNVPYGTCNLTVPYTIPQTNEESYIHVTELVRHNLMDDFNRNYDELKSVYEESLREWEANKETHKYERILPFDEVRKAYDHTILRFSFLCPEEKRSFRFKTDVGNTAVRAGENHSSIYLYSLAGDEKREDGLQSKIVSLGEVNGEPKGAYDLTLQMVTDCQEVERIEILKKNFDCC